MLSWKKRGVVVVAEDFKKYKGMDQHDLLMLTAWKVEDLADTKFPALITQVKEINGNVRNHSERITTLETAKKTAEEMQHAMFRRRTTVISVCVAIGSLIFAIGLQCNWWG